MSEVPNDGVSPLIDMLAKAKAENYQPEAALQPSSNDRCLAFGCDNKRHEGIFVRDFCAPCWQFITTSIGAHGTAFFFAQQHSQRVRFEKYHSMQGLLMRIASSDSPLSQAASDILAGRVTASKGSDVDLLYELAAGLRQNAMIFRQQGQLARERQLNQSADAMCTAADELLKLRNTP